MSGPRARLSPLDRLLGAPVLTVARAEIQMPDGRRLFTAAAARLTESLRLASSRGSVVRRSQLPGKVGEPDEKEPECSDTAKRQR